MARLLRPRLSGPVALRTLLGAGGPVLAPGAFDGLSARLVEAAGFEAVYMTGFGSAASRLGRPDVGLLDLSEMVDTARRVVAAVDVPVVADADTGYGNAINVVRTVQEHERAGVAALHLEDQVSPKRCGHTAGTASVTADEFASKIAAAVQARSPEGPLIIARTDARATEGYDAAVERARRYRDAGADLCFVEALTGADELARLPRDLPDVPLVLNWVEQGRTPPVGLHSIAEWGYALVIFPLTALLAATSAMRSTLADLRRLGTPPARSEVPAGVGEMTELLGLGEIDELRQRFP